MSVFCQQQGGAVFGKVFHDTNQNGIYEPHLGETGFHSDPSQLLRLELVDCDSASLSCDSYNYALPWYDELRRFPISIPFDHGDIDNSTAPLYCPDPQNGGCFAFECQDCWGTYKVRLSRDINPVEYGWNTSPVEKGQFREGWIPGSSDPPVINVVQNNFESFESVCFNMLSDMVSLESYNVVLDLGIYLNDDVPMIGETRGEGFLNVQKEMTDIERSILKGSSTLSPSLSPSNTVMIVETIEHFGNNHPISTDDTTGNGSTYVPSRSPIGVPMTASYPTIAPTHKLSIERTIENSISNKKRNKKISPIRLPSLNGYGRFRKTEHEQVKQRKKIDNDVDANEKENGNGKKKRIRKQRRKKRNYLVY